MRTTTTATHDRQSEGTARARSRARHRRRHQARPGADLRFEHIPAAKVDVLKKAIGRWPGEPYERIDDEIALAEYRLLKRRATWAG